MFLKLTKLIILSIHFNSFIICIYFSNNRNYLIKEQCFYTTASVDCGKTATCGLNKNCEDCAAWNGRKERRRERPKKRERLKKKEEEREQVRYVSRDFRYGRRRCGVYTRGGERSVSARAYSGRGRSGLAARSLPEFTSRFLDTDQRRRGRIHIITRSPSRSRRDPGTRPAT